MEFEEGTVSRRIHMADWFICIEKIVEKSTTTKFDRLQWNLPCMTGKSCSYFASQFSVRSILPYEPFVFGQKGGVPTGCKHSTEDFPI